jgi:hypothetical protein
MGFFRPDDDDDEDDDSIVIAWVCADTNTTVITEQLVLDVARDFLGSDEPRIDHFLVIQ